MGTVWAGVNKVSGSKGGGRGGGKYPQESKFEVGRGKRLAGDEGVWEGDWGGRGEGVIEGG